MSVYILLAGFLPRNFTEIGGEVGRYLQVVNFRLLSFMLWVFEFFVHSANAATACRGEGGKAKFLKLVA